jgi:CDP-paratose 2-epimerase
MNIIITGGAGFIGSHVAAYYASKDNDVTIIDNFSRTKLLKKNSTEISDLQNWTILKKNHPSIKLYNQDVRDHKKIEEIFAQNKDNIDVVFHTAGQTAITSSVEDPREDFENNVVTTFNILDAVRKYASKATVLYCSTNKVFGSKPNSIELIEERTRYKFKDPNFNGINENFSIDQSGHTPYGASKLAGDIYMQEFSHTYGIRTGVFRMSCIYGPNQMSFEDQGWVVYMIKKAVKDHAVTIYGDGKQVRDILYIDDLVELYNQFITKKNIGSNVFCVGGGIKNSISLRELLAYVEDKKGIRVQCNYMPWRNSDQKVYISDITKAKLLLNWSPKISAYEGIDRILNLI